MKSRAEIFVSFVWMGIIIWLINVFIIENIEHDDSSPDFYLCVKGKRR